MGRENLQATADGLSFTAAQIFLGSPKRWARPTPGAKEVKELKALTFPLYIHAPYLFNPASANDEVRAKTAQALQKELDNCALVGAAGLVIHGGQGGKDSTMEEALIRWEECLQQLTFTTPLLIENTAGGYTAPARHLKDFSKLMAMATPYGASYCIDTCHSWSGGFGLKDLHGRLLEAVGQGPAMVHLNGTREALASGRDRHANFQRGEEQTELSLTFAKDAGVPVLLETPGEAFMADVKLLQDELAPL